MIPVPDGAVEIVSGRNKRRKLVRLADGRLQSRVGLSAIHTPDDWAAYREGRPHGWSDMSLDPAALNAWYSYSVTGNGQILFTRLADGAQVRLRLNGFPIPQTGTVQGDEIVYADVAPSLDLRVKMRPESIEVYKVLKSAAAPHTLNWRVRERGGLTEIAEKTAGRDAAGNRLAIANAVTNRVQVANGDQQRVMTETITGTLVRQPGTRIWQPGPPPVYPLTVDVTVNLAADADDGYEYNGAWQATAEESYGGWLAGHWSAYMAGGVRFQLPTLASTDTITAGTLFCQKEATQVGTPSTVTWRADVGAQRNAAWGATARPHNGWTSSTASAVMSGLSTNGQKTANIADILTELKDLAGWAAGDWAKLATLAYDPTTNDASVFSKFGDATEAYITYTFTSGGGGELPFRSRIAGGHVAGPGGAFRHDPIVRRAE